MSEAPEKAPEIERERLIVEARQLIADAGDGPLSEQATARFSEIEQQLDRLRDEQDQRPDIVDPTRRPLPMEPNTPSGHHNGLFAEESPHPLAYTAQALTALQAAIDAHEPLRVRAADPRARFATITTTTHGAPRAWGANVLTGPRLLSQVAGVPRQPVEAVLAQFPQLTLPTAQPVTAEAASLTEYASSAAGSVTLGRFGRWTDMSREALIGADAAAITGMHRVGIALDLDQVLIDAVETAAGTAVAFAADVPAQIRKAMAQVQANTASDDPADLVILAHPDDVHLLQDVSPTGGSTIAERFQRFSGALVYPSNAVSTGFMTVANLRVGARYFEAVGLSTATQVDVKTGVETVATYTVAGYGVTLTTGFAVMQDVVTP
ncbi:hypothetical protein FHU38_003411 [Saccharomonospora amisosensis]|uniref:HK97 family phage major capsid protein n=1 Tax=Saccharomonospora amisosensis TaxID=1128677 RepID=A0A7X5URX0_9PSEU|nr:hypothetical protein [Saccharomonospora amisosensis]NIJ13067.1 hypothetical protein [Saccharomonospora amisosensis]